MLRRVRSNLDEVKAFSKTTSYLPRQAAFEAADADLLKLLIGPLYGNKPEIGIRELVQNSVDAVRELKEFRSKHPEMEPIGVFEIDAEVVISVEQDEKKQWWLIISDQGIGMSEEIICNYFLRAGASYRRSDAWRREFEDECHSSKVLRSGRFGVGALAAFLLGEEIHVSTRHVSSPAGEGIKFHGTIDTSAIELQKADLPVGTCIRISISDDIAEDLKGTLWRTPPQNESRDFYQLDSPTVVRRHQSNQENLKQSIVLADEGEDLLPKWRRIPVEGYSDIQWSYNSYGATLTCNGLRVGSAHTQVLDRKLDIALPYLHFKIPSLSVFDPDGHLPLNLQRNELTHSELPFESLLKASIFEDFLAHLLVHGTKAVLDYQHSYPGLSKIYQTLCPWVITKDGFGLLNRWTFSKLNLESIWLTNNSLKDLDCASVKEKLDKKIGILCFNEECTDLKWSRFILQEKKLLLDASSENTTVLGAKIWLGSEAAKYFNEPRKLLKETRCQLNFVDYKNRTTAVSIGAIDKSSEEIDSFTDALGEQLRKSNPNSTQYAKWTIEPQEEQRKAEHSPQQLLIDPQEEQKKTEQDIHPLLLLWQKTIGQPLIPFSEKERKEVLSKAYSKLAPFIDMHLAEIAQDEEKQKK